MARKHIFLFSFFTNSTMKFLEIRKKIVKAVFEVVIWTPLGYRQMLIFLTMNISCGCFVRSPFYTSQDVRVNAMVSECVHGIKKIILPVLTPENSYFGIIFTLCFSFELSHTWLVKPSFAVAWYDTYSSKQYTIYNKV